MTDFGKIFSDLLIRWHETAARDLPWRGEKDPYKIWISEIMLQQTRTETVKSYYANFLNAFADVFQLANAPEEEVLKLWEGLGYYSRARNLHAAAKKVAYELAGVFPDRFETLKTLPGVGNYAAGAIASIAFGKVEPALDGNQARVLTRVLNIDRVIKSPAVLYERALELVDENDPGEYNQALMGLGAMVCTPKNPKCESCPVRSVCASYRIGNQHELPRKPEKLKRRIETRGVALVINDEGSVYVRKRESGMLVGLWEFPGYTDARSMADVCACLEEEGILCTPLCEIGKHKHIFTHLEWHMTGYLLKAVQVPEGAVFADREMIDALAMPMALVRYREYFRNREIK